MSSPSSSADAEIIRSVDDETSKAISRSDLLTTGQNLALSMLSPVDALLNLKHKINDSSSCKSSSCDSSVINRNPEEVYVKNRLFDPENVSSDFSEEVKTVYFGNVDNLDGTVLSINIYS